MKFPFDTSSRESEFVFGGVSIAALEIDIVCEKNEKFYLIFGAFKNDGKTYEFNFQLDRKCNELCSKSLSSRTHFFFYFPLARVPYKFNHIAGRVTKSELKKVKKSQQQIKCIEIVAGELPRLI